MSGLNALFRQRIGISPNETITFETLPRVLSKTATTIPFENLGIMANMTSPVTKENLTHKILVNYEGGLCYELNSMLYFFLIENGFRAVLTRGVVYKEAAQQYMTLGRTHVTILIAHEGQTYLVDTGFGGNLPLKPVPLTGETVTSDNGQFRIRNENSGYGDYVLEMKLKHKDTDWRIGYAFDSRRPVTDVTEFDEIQTIIAEHPDSPFNKNRLITKLTRNGNVTLTNTSLTRWEDGSVTKEEIDPSRFRELLNRHFGIEMAAPE